MVEKQGGYWNESIREEIFTFTRYRRDTVISKPSSPTLLQLSPGTKRGKCFQLSYKSRRNLAFTASNTAINFKAMVTMTYHPDAAPRTGREAKKHLNSFMQKYRRNKIPFLWFMEFQQNTSVHFHVLTEAVLCDPSKRANVAQIQHRLGGVDYASSSAESIRWAAIVKKGVVPTEESAQAIDKMSRASVRVEYLKRKDGAARYVAKYAYKTYQKIVPPNFTDTGRFWGCTKDVKPLPLSSEEGKLPDDVKYFYAPSLSPEGEVMDYSLYPYRIQFGKQLGKK